MKFIADLPIHSHYSRTTSGDLVPEQVRATFLPLADQGQELKTRFKKSTLVNIFHDKVWTIK